MPEVLVENGIAYEVEGEYDEDEVFQPAAGSVVSEPEGAPEPKPAPRETVRYDNPTPRRAAPGAKVEIIQVPPPASADEAGPTDEELQEWETELDEWLDQKAEEKANAKLDEATKRVQSVKDKEIAKEAKRADKLESRITELEASLESAKLSGLSPEEKEAYQDSQAMQKQRAELISAADELDAIYKERHLSLLVDEYGYIGVTMEDLEDIEDPDEAEKLCKQAEKFYLAGGGGKKPAAVAEAKPVARVAKPVPAGSRAPTDIGGESPILGRAKTFNNDQSMDAMAENLNNTPWETVRIGR